LLLAANLQHLYVPPQAVTERGPSRLHFRPAAARNLLPQKPSAFEAAERPVDIVSPFAALKTGLFLPAPLGGVSSVAVAPAAPGSSRGRRHSARREREHDNPRPRLHRLALRGGERVLHPPADGVHTVPARVRPPAGRHLHVKLQRQHRQTIASTCGGGFVAGSAAPQDSAA
ncbi:unnamed protein product, partial [Ectocarpus sp. 8 AP-2014]